LKLQVVVVVVVVVVVGGGGGGGVVVNYKTKGKPKCFPLIPSNELYCRCLSFHSMEFAGLLTFSFSTM